MNRTARRGIRLPATQRRSALQLLTRNALLLSAVGLAALAFGSSTASASAQEYSFRASAWGTELHVGSVVKSGRSAFVILGCTSTLGVNHSNTVASVKIPKALFTGTIDTDAASKATHAGVASTSSAATQHVNLLGGVVKATAIKAVSTTRHNASTGKFSTSAAGTHFVNLVIGGHAISGTPPANTKIPLPGIGYVVLNQHTSHVGSTSAGLRVIGIHLVVTGTTKRAKSGTELDVSVANSSLKGPVTGVLRGLSFGTSAHAGSTVIAGRSFPEYMPCLGTAGKTIRNTGVGGALPGVLSSGTITSTVNGTVSSTQDSGETSSTIEHMKLLAGVIRASAVRADITANGNPPALGDNSSFVGLHVTGHPEINDSVPANTQVNLPGIGTLWLHKLVETSQGIKVIMIQLLITSHINPAGLPVGAKIDIGYASVSVS
jgi:hypothetical protein